MLRKRKYDARQEIIKELDEFERARKAADEKSEIREISNEEKSLNELIWPETWSFPVHKKFRLWLSVIPVPNFPANFARRCLKVSLELPSHIRPNTIKSLSSFSTNTVSTVQRN